jgi:hypothetical protein
MTLILYIIALVCFLTATFPIPTRGSLIAAGLALLTATLVIGALH